MIVLKVERWASCFLVHSEVNANELGFNGLSPIINVLNGLKHFMAKVNHLLNPKTIKYISAINL